MAFWPIVMVMDTLKYIYKIHLLFVFIHPISESIIRHRQQTISNWEQKIFILKLFNTSEYPTKRIEPKNFRLRLLQKKKEVSAIGQRQPGKLLTRVCQRRALLLLTVLQWRAQLCSAAHMNAELTDAVPQKSPTTKEENISLSQLILFIPSRGFES